MKHVLILSPGEDTGGVGIAIKRAFDRHAPDWKVRYVRGADNYIRYPADLEWTRPERRYQVRQLWAEADLVHMMLGFAPADRFPGYHRKPRILHHHGNVFNRRPAPLLARAKAEGIISLVSTLDMLRPDPGYLEWLPNPCHTEAMAAIRQEHYTPGPRPRLVHSPTSRQRKGTEAFLAGVDQLVGLFDLELVEHQTWATCLARKATGDLLFDQFGPAGYALNSIEAWAMGIPTIGGADPWTLERTRQEFGELPYAEATPDTIRNVVATLISSADARAEVAARGAACLAAYHEERQVVQRLIGIYERALA